MAASTSKAREKDFLFSKGDISELLGLTTQALANRQARDDKFPQPTYSNKSGSVQLYTKDDVKKIHEHLASEERARIEKLEAALNGGL